jgi:class 3 adenylate cyclase
VTYRAEPVLDYGIGTYRTGDVLEGLLAKVSELDRDLAVNLIVGGRRDADAARFGDTLKSCSDIDTVTEDILALDQNIALVKTTGDGVLLEFPSVVDAVECAVAMQAVMPEWNDGVPVDRRMLYRMGINLGGRDGPQV